jgi:hypothetical protein
VLKCQRQVGILTSVPTRKTWLLLPAERIRAEWSLQRPPYGGLIVFNSGLNVSFATGLGAYDRWNSAVFLLKDV